MELFDMFLVLQVEIWVDSIKSYIWLAHGLPEGWNIILCLGYMPENKLSESIFGMKIEIESFSLCRTRP